MNPVTIELRQVGPGYPCFIVAEIGINHNGDIATAKKLIDVAVAAGCDAVKFQKRTPELCVPKEQRDVLKETPWGTMTYMEYRERVEFGEEEYDAIDVYCREKGILWFASCWDVPSVDFIEQYGPPCYKVASASLTDDKLLAKLADLGRPVILSTGMSHFFEVIQAISTLNTPTWPQHSLILMHTCSAYPAEYKDLNLRVITTLRDKFGVPVGYSGHETGLATSIAAVALGACVLERHITLDRAMWGSDQAASLAPEGLKHLVRDVRLVEQAMGSPVKRLLDCELSNLNKLRRKPCNG